MGQAGCLCKHMGDVGEGQGYRRPPVFNTAASIPAKSDHNGCVSGGAGGAGEQRIIRYRYSPLDTGMLMWSRLS